MRFAFSPPSTDHRPLSPSLWWTPTSVFQCNGLTVLAATTKNTQKNGLHRPGTAVFFLKPTDATVVAETGQAASLAYPSLTRNLHHQVELVAAIGRGGKNILAANVQQHIYSYTVALGMTRRYQQTDMKKQGRS